MSGPEGGKRDRLLLGIATGLLAAVDVDDVEQAATDGVHELLSDVDGARAALIRWPGPGAVPREPHTRLPCEAAAVAAALGCGPEIGALFMAPLETPDATVMAVASPSPLPPWLTRPLETVARQAEIALLRARTADQRSRHREEERFRALVRCSSDVITVLGEDGKIRYQSPSVRTVLGYSPSELIGRSLFEVLHPDDAAAAIAAYVESADKDGLAEPVESRWVRRDGSYLNVETVTRNLLDDAELEGFVLTTRDVTERKRLEAKLTELAFRDPLTGLPNRALLADRMTQAIARSERSGTDTVFLLVDVDDFKAVNDGLGHAAGDALLIEIGRRLTRSVRDADTVARIGGDEFAIVTEVVGLDGAFDVADRVHHAMEAPFAVGDARLHVRLSVGIAVWSVGENDAEDLMCRADTAMYAAKLDGGGRCEVFEPSMRQAMLRRLETIQQ